MNHKKNIFSRIAHEVQSLFLSGLFALLPMTLTVAVFTLTFRLVRGWLEPLRQFELPFIGQTPYSEFILALIIIFAAGTLYNMFILRAIIDTLDNLLHKIPLIRPVYSGIKKLVDAFSFQDKGSFTNVVIVEFPRPGVYSVGFLASEFDSSLSPDATIKYFSVFIPTTPNPTTGFLIILPEEQIKKINISRQEAMTMIISGGIIQPEIKK